MFCMGGFFSPLVNSSERSRFSSIISRVSTEVEWCNLSKILFVDVCPTLF